MGKEDYAILDVVTQNPKDLIDAVTDNSIKELSSLADAFRSMQDYIRCGSQSSFRQAVTAAHPETIAKWLSAPSVKEYKTADEKRRYRHMYRITSMLSSKSRLFTVVRTADGDITKDVSLSYSGRVVVRFRKGDKDDMYKCVHYDVVTPLIVSKVCMTGDSEEDQVFRDGLYEIDQLLSSGSKFGGRLVTGQEMYSILDYITQGGACSKDSHEKEPLN